MKCTSFVLATHRRENVPRPCKSGINDIIDSTHCQTSFGYIGRNNTFSIPSWFNFSAKIEQVPSMYSCADMKTKTSPSEESKCIGRASILKNGTVSVFRHGVPSCKHSMKLHLYLWVAFQSHLRVRPTFCRSID